MDIPETDSGHGRRVVVGLDDTVGARAALRFALDDGRLLQGYKVGETPTAIQVREAAFGEVVQA